MDSVRRSARLQSKPQTLNPRVPRPNVAQPKKASATKAVKETRGFKKRKVTTGNDSITQTKRRARPRGKLHKFTDTPLDVLFEILSYLGPGDLANVSRSSKTFQNLLDQPSAAYVWRQTFTNIGDQHPPLRPSSITESQYAAFLFDASGPCHYCSKKSLDILWGHLYWCCEVCIPKYFTTGHEVWTMYRRSHSICTLIDALCVSSKTRSRKNYRHDSTIYLKTDVLAAVAQDAEGVKPNSESVLATKATVKDITKFVYATSLWERDRKKHRKIELQKIRADRRQAIFAKLADLGWAEEIEIIKNDRVMSGKVNECYLFTPGKPLTDRAWAAIRDETIEFMKNMKHVRVSEATHTAYRSRIYILAGMLKSHHWRCSYTQAVPRVQDVAAFPAFKEVIMRPYGDTVTEADFKPLMADIDDLADEWYQFHRQFLLDLVPAEYSAPAFTSASANEGDPSSLNYPTTFFSCARCTEPISFARALQHHCLYHGLTSVHAWETDDVFLRACIYTGGRPLSYGLQDRIFFDEEAAKAMRRILTVCGDAEEINVNEFDARDVRLECKRCLHVKKGRLVMTWRAALLHELKDHQEEIEADDNSAVDWQLVNDSTDLELVAAGEAKALSRVKYPDEPQRRRLCNICRLVIWNLRGYEDHMNVHGLEDSDWHETTHSYPDESLNRRPYSVRI